MGCYVGMAVHIYRGPFPIKLSAKLQNFADIAASVCAEGVTYCCFSDLDEYGIDRPQPKRAGRDEGEDTKSQ